MSESKQYDIFISYRRDGGSEMARLLFEKFKSLGYSVFFDREELRSGVFDVRLYAAIEVSNNVVIVLPEHGMERCANEGDWLRLEIVRALNCNKNIVPVFMRGFSWPTNLPPDMDKVQRFNGVEFSHTYFDASVQRIESHLTNVTTSIKLNQDDHSEMKDAPRISNRYFTAQYEAETRRLGTQQSLLREFDAMAYKKVRDEVGDPVVLDLGSHNGDVVMDRFGGDVKALLGVEYDAETVVVANDRHGECGRISFVCADLESPEIESRIQDGMRELQIQSFNVITMSMILMHLKNPHLLLKRVRRFLSPGGMVLVRDIDDGMNVAYPDEDGAFERVVAICNRNETSGYRHSGRQINAFLKRAGFKDVCLEKIGITTVGMDYDQRDALFDTYFSFIKDDLKLMTERHPDDARIAEDYSWYCQNYDDLSARFQDEAFFFSLGFMLFTARKHP